MLPEAAGLRPFACLRVVGSEEMKEIGGLKAGRMIGLSLFIDQQRKLYAGFFAEHRRVARVTEADGGQLGLLRLEFLLMFTQLRDVLAAEDSAVVPEKNDHRRV